jgi:hypothetical protein
VAVVWGGPGRCGGRDHQRCPGAGDADQLGAGLAAATAQLADLTALCDERDALYPGKD